MSGTMKKILRLQNIMSQQIILFVIVADFHAITIKIDSCEPSSSNVISKILTFKFLLLIYAYSQYKSTRCVPQKRLLK